MLVATIIDHSLCSVVVCKTVSRRAPECRSAHLRKSTKFQITLTWPGTRVFLKMLTFLNLVFHWRGISTGVSTNTKNISWELAWDDHKDKKNEMFPFPCASFSVACVQLGPLSCALAKRSNTALVYLFFACGYRTVETCLCLFMSLSHKSKQLSSLLLFIMSSISLSSRKFLLVFLLQDTPLQLSWRSVKSRHYDLCALSLL